MEQEKSHPLDGIVRSAGRPPKSNGSAIPKNYRNTTKTKPAKKLSAKEQLFVNYYLTGSTCGDVCKSYLAAGFVASPARLKSYANYLFRTERVVNEIARIKLILANREIRESNILTIEEKRSFLASVVRADINNPDSKVIQEKSVDKDGNAKVKLCNKLEALKIDNDIAGDYYGDRDNIKSNVFNFLISMGKLNDNNCLPSQEQEGLPACNAQAGLPAQAGYRKE